MAATPSDDFAQPFQIGSLDLHGRFVRLGAALDAAVGRRGHAHPVAHLLAETVTLAATLAATLKFEGVLSLQAKGEGPVALVVADCRTDGRLRAYARADEARLPAAWRAGEAASIPALLGPGFLATTVDQGPDTERYQSIVELSAPTLAECVGAYFRRSDQLDAGLRLAVTRDGTKWRSGAIMIQRLAEARPPGPRPAADEEDAWRRAMILLASATVPELAATDVHPHTVLYRLFREDGVRVHAPQALSFGCHCSRARARRTALTVPAAERADYLEDGRMAVTCEFCGRRYDFDAQALNRAQHA